MNRIEQTRRICDEARAERRKAFRLADTCRTADQRRELGGEAGE